MKYPKIKTIFNRDDKFKVVEGDYRVPEFENVKNWYVTEKIDGTNVRVIYEPQFPRKEGGMSMGLSYEVEYAGHTLRYAGRTDKSQLHPTLTAYLEKTFTIDKLHEIFPDKQVEGELSQYPHVLLFGEGYGPKIQKGDNYRPDVSFRLFDVYIYDKEHPMGGWWLEPENVLEIATKLGIETVPHLFTGSTDTIVEFVKSRNKSFVAESDSGNSRYLMEGVVARTKPLLFNRRGERLIWKLKLKDFPPVNKNE